MPYKLRDRVRHKFDQKQYNKRDWPTYEGGLCRRGDVEYWISEDAIEQWRSEASGKAKRGRPLKYSALAIETMHVMRLVYQKPLRFTEGFVKSIFRLMGLDLPVPDHTTVSRRAQKLEVKRKKIPQDQNIVVLIDSTGLKVVGEREWMNYKHGTRVRKVWRKLSLGTDEHGEIIAATLTTHTDSDCSQVDPLLRQIDAPIAEAIADSAYDQPATYRALEEHQLRHGQDKPITAIIPPNTGFRKERDTDPAQRLANIRVIEDKGKHKWQDLTRYGRRAGAENSMHRYKSLTGGKLRAKHFQSQEVEVQIVVQILNRMASLGMPKSRPST